MKALATILSACLLVIAACGSTTVNNLGESDNVSPEDEKTTISGTVPSKGAGGSTKGVSVKNQCKADTVVATDANGNQTRALVKSDCSFELEVKQGRFYRIHFESKYEYVATLQYTDGSVYYRSYFYVSYESTYIELSSVSFSREVALSAEDLFEQTDCDENHNGISELLEEDCDLDGIPDDWDPQSDCDTDGDAGLFARVLQVKPPHDPQGNHPVDLKQKVRARINCKVDDDLLNDATFRVQSDNGLHWVDCQFRLQYDADKKESKITCEHNDDPFEPELFYDATIEGLLCDDRAIVEAKNWTWLTEEEEEPDPEPEPNDPDLALPDVEEIADSLIDQIEEGICDRTIDADFNGNLKVRKGEDCVIEAEAHVDGNIEVDAGVLTITGEATIDGDISSTGGTEITIEEGVTVTGDLSVEVKAGEDGAELTVLDSKIKGNVSSKGGATLTLKDNQIDGDLDLDNDYTSCTEINNLIGGNNDGC